MKAQPREKELPARFYRWFNERTGINSMMHASLDEPIPGGARLAYIFRLRPALHLYLAGDYRAVSRALLCSFRGVGTYQRRLYHQAGSRRAISSQSALLRLQRHDHRAAAAFSADIYLWLVQRPARAALDVGRVPVLSGARHGVHRIPASLGPERLLRHGCRNQHCWAKFLSSDNG